MHVGAFLFRKSYYCCRDGRLRAKGLPPMGVEHFPKRAGGDETERKERNFIHNGRLNARFAF